jgi:hypothetical protein
MSQRSKGLAERLKVFTDDVIDFVDTCSDNNWRRICAAENWSVGVTARHIGAGHSKAVALARMMVNSEKLPEITMERTFIPCGWRVDYATVHRGGHP